MTYPVQRLLVNIESAVFSSTLCSANLWTSTVCVWAGGSWASINLWFRPPASANNDSAVLAVTNGVTHRSLLNRTLLTISAEVKPGSSQWEIWHWGSEGGAVIPPLIFLCVLAAEDFAGKSYQLCILQHALELNSGLSTIKNVVFTINWNKCTSIRRQWS